MKGVPDAMKIAIPREVFAGETRVACVPQTAARMVRAKHEVMVEAGAGQGAYFSDAQYQAVGARIVADPAELFGQADIVLKVNRPTADAASGRCEIDLLPKGTVLVAVLAPPANVEMVQKLAEGGVSSFALDAVPRITRAQAMDVLSSQATVAGYRSVLLAVAELPRLAPLLMTAAGTVKPANVLIIGAGVAGLQAIATARRLGAVVKAVDTRPAVKEQIESLGARFVHLPAHEGAESAGGYAADLGEAYYRQEQQTLAPHVREADVIITTALIPGRPAPILITREMVESMRPGAVIVDVSIPMGGNCTLSRPDERVRHAQVSILAPTNLPAQAPVSASEMFSHNAHEFLKEMLTKEGRLQINLDNEVLRKTLVTHEGQIVYEPLLKTMANVR